MPISLVISLSKTLSGLHWNQIPNDNDNEVAARGILYLLIFQQLGQLVRWSWGYHVLLAPREHYYRDEEERANGRLDNSHERYTDDPDEEVDPTLVGTNPNSGRATPSHSGSNSEPFESGSQTPISERHYPISKFPYNSSENGDSHENHASAFGIPPRGEFLPRQDTGIMTSFPHVETQQDESTGRIDSSGCSRFSRMRQHARSKAMAGISRLPLPVQKSIRWIAHAVIRFTLGVWEFMNPPLWAMLAAILVASIPSLQKLFFTPGTFVSNSVTRAVEQSGSVAVPLILVVLGANLARNTLPKEAVEDMDDPREEKKLIIASLIARMLLPTIVIGPILALTAKYVPVSILGDPIFVIVCFLLTGAPSALQLAQICQINNVYMGAMARILFQSYVVWYVKNIIDSLSLLYTFICYI